MASVTNDDVARVDLTSNYYQIYDDISSTPNLNVPPYVAPSNTFSDSSDGSALSYYYVTNSDPGVTQKDIAIGGNTYSCKVIVGKSMKDMADGGSSIFKPNTTIFFDAGAYTDDLQYEQYSYRNLSIVGLNTASNGEPAAIITRIPVSAKHPSKLERKFFNAADIYIENLVFSGGGYDMAYNKEGGAGGSRAEYFFVVNNGATNLVMKDVIVEKLGASNSDGFTNFHKNVAFNILYSCADNGGGQKNFENLTVRSIKTTQTSMGQGYGAISLNQSDQCYFKNLTVDMSLAAANAYSVKIENSDVSYQTDVTKNSAIFSGVTTLSDKRIYVQDYRYKDIVVPYDNTDASTFRYIQYRNSNGSTSSQAMTVFSTLPAVTTNYAVLDRADNYWIAREDYGISVNNQLNYIKQAVAAMKTLYTNTDRQIPPINIKLIVNGEIDGFTVPDFGSNVKVNIIALDYINDPYTFTDLVPVAAKAAFNLGSTVNSANVVLYNFDFNEKATYTFQQATAGIAGNLTPADPYDGTYPTGVNLKYSEYALVGDTAKVTGYTGTVIAPAAFVNCKFTELAKTLVLAPSSASLRVGGTVSANGSISAFYTAAAAVNFTGTSNATDNDSTIHYYSSDAGIVAVDEKSGIITGVSIGSAVIYAKAGDKNNEGEMEKPWDSFTVTVSAANVAPTATDDTATTEKNTPVIINVLANGSDSDGDKLTITAVSTPANGSVVINSDGTVTYTSKTDFVGTDTFTYTISDSNGGTATATITVTVSEDAIVVPPVERYAVIYHANTDNLAASITDAGYIGGSTVTAKGSIFSAPEGKIFLGWSLKFDGPIKYDEGATFVMPFSNLHLYAVWQSASPLLNKEDHFAYMQGYPKGDFRPNSNMTRAEATVMFSRLRTKQMNMGTKYANTFSDVSADAWYANAIGYMEQNNIIRGYSDGSFRPDAYITRAEFAVIATRFEAIKTGLSNNFTDVPVGYWAYDSIGYAVSRGWVKGYTDNSFKPDNNITRAEVVTLTNRVLERAADKDYITANAGLIKIGNNSFVEVNSSFIKAYSDTPATYWAYYDILESSNGHNYTKNDSKETWTSLK